MAFWDAGTGSKKPNYPFHLFNSWQYLNQMGIELTHLKGPWKVWAYPEKKKPCSFPLLSWVAYEASGPWINANLSHAFGCLDSWWALINSWLTFRKLWKNTCLRRSWRNSQQSPLFAWDPHLRPGSHSWALPCLCCHALHGHVPCWSTHSPWPTRWLLKLTSGFPCLYGLAWPVLESVPSDLLTTTSPGQFTSVGCCGVVSFWGMCLVYIITLSIPLFFPCRVLLCQYYSLHLWNLFLLSVWKISFCLE